MPFVAAKCKQCGHNMQVDESLERGFCPACGTPYVKEDVVNNYNTYNTTNYQIEHADVVISDSSSIEKWLENAEVFLTVHHDYDKAKELFKKVTDDAPADYRGWWGLVRTLTCNLNKTVFYHFETMRLLSNNSNRNTNIEESLININGEIATYAKRAIGVATGDAQRDIKCEWDSFLNDYSNYAKQKYEDAIRQKEEDRVNQISKLKSEADAILVRLSEIEQEIYKCDEIRTTNYNKGGNGCALSVAGVISLLVLSNLWTPFFFLGGILLIVGVIILGWTAINKQDDHKEAHEMSKKISELSKESKNLKSKYDDLNKQISFLSVKR